jgi:hypothetical protein
MTKPAKRTRSFCPEESNVFEALEGLREGDERPVAGYVRELAEIERFLATLFDPESRVRLVSEGKKQRCSSDADAGLEDPDGEWVGSFPQIKGAIESGNLEAFGALFRNQARFHNALADSFSGRGRSPWRLRFGRKRRGRPSADAWRKLLTDSRTARAVKLATQKSGKGGIPGKQGMAIEDLKPKLGSRATIMRRMARERTRSQSVKASLTKLPNK